MQSSADFPDAFYRVSIRGLMRSGDKFLLGYHVRHWETFGGGLDFGEDIHEALLREIKEETGCEAKILSDKPLFILPAIVKGRRNMDWFYNLPIYYEVELDLDQFDYSLQYSEYRWFTAEEIQDLVIFEGESGLKQAVQNLS